MKTKLLFFLFVCCSLTAAQTKLFWQNPQPPGTSFNDVHFFNSNNGIAVSGGGAIFKTADGGLTWKEENISTDFYWNLKDVFFIDEQNGWIAGEKIYGWGFSVLLKTADGGKTWQLKNNGAPTGLNSVYFLNANTGWVASKEGNMAKTTDGGETWTTVTTGVTNEIDFIYFLNENEGIAAGHSIYGSSTKIKTADGGKTWSTYSDFPGNLYCVCGITASTLYAAGDNLVQSADGGKTWTDLGTAPTSSIEKYVDIHFINAGTGFIAVEKYGGRVYKTTDAGATWTRMTLPGGSSVPELTNLSVLDENSVIVFGTSGYIAKTTDGGASWIEAGAKGNTGFNVNSVFFVNEKKGFATGFKQMGATICTTVDGGKTWKDTTAKTFKPYDIYFVDSLYGWSSGDGGSISKTTDGGVTWESLTSNSWDHLYSIFFLDRHNGWTCGTNQGTFRTTDGGTTWEMVSSSQGEDIFFLDLNNGLKGGVNTAMSITNDGGKTWTDFGFNGGSFSFVDKNTGWGLSSDEVIKTTDAGKTWTKTKIPDIYSGLNAIVFSDASNGWIAGGSGAVLNTTDGGTTWNRVPVSTTENLNCIAVSGNNVWIGGDYGIILSSVSQEEVTAVSDRNSSAAPQSFALDQNFPNPFNPSTTIRYSVINSGNVTLKVYDILGKEVAELVNSFHNAGSYTAHFNASELSSGIFFYILQSGNSVSTKKMLLLK